MADKKTYTKVMTPEGTLVFPQLNAPDFKFAKEKGAYSAKIRLGVDESATLIEQLEAALAKYWPAAVAELEQKVKDAKDGPSKAKAKKALAEIKEADKAYKPAYDDEGNETGEYEFNFKMPAQYTSQKDGKIVKLKPSLFDAKGKPMKVVPQIWGGTKAAVAGEFRPFSMPIGVGISLRLKAVQVLELSSGSGGGSAESFGFSKREDGYEAEDEPSMADHVPANTDEPAGGDEDF